jgi:hypothetical protein
MTSVGGNAIVGSMTPPVQRIRDARADQARRLSTQATVMASIATAVAEIVQWPLLVAADRAVHLLERLRRHPDAACS